MRIHIKQGRVIDPVSGTDAVRDLFLADGKIAAVGAVPAGFRADRVIDAAGLVVCPGLVDLSVRLREPGFEYRATLESEMQAAVAGGVTSLVCPPDTDPPLDEPGLVEMLKFRARSLNQARVYPLGALTQGLRGERLTEMAQLHDAGCVAFSQADALQEKIIKKNDLFFQQYRPQNRTYIVGFRSYEQGRHVKTLEDLNFIITWLEGQIALNRAPKSKVYQLTPIK